MHLESARDLYSFYSLENKTDAYIAYLYLKHVDHFMQHVYETLNLPARPLQENLGETLDDILTGYVAQIAEAAGSLETNIYHGKVVTLKDAIQLVTQKNPLALPPVSERVLPYKIARDVILEHPEAIAIGQCACRKVAKDPCLTGKAAEVCMMVGEPWVSFLCEHNSRMFRRIGQTEAVEALQAAHERGDVHAAYFKKEMRGRFFAICNCCDCCCIGMRMWNMLDGAVPFLAPSGYSMKVGEDCTGCGACAADDGCPFHAISMDVSGKAVVDHAKCMGCSACERTCVAGALQLTRDPSKGDPLDLEALKRELHVST